MHSCRSALLQRRSICELRDFISNNKKDYIAAGETACQTIYQQHCLHSLATAVCGAWCHPPLPATPCMAVGAAIWGLCYLVMPTQIPHQHHMVAVPQLCLMVDCVRFLCRQAQ